MRYRVQHITRYSYSDPVQLCRNEAFLLPRQTAYQQCLESRLTIEPEATDIHERLDFFGNRANHFAVQLPHEELTISAISDVDVQFNPHDYERAAAIPWENARMGCHQLDETLNCTPFLCESPLIASNRDLAAYAMPSFSAGRPISDAAEELMQRIYHDFTYDAEFTDISTPLPEVLHHRRGVCQDFAHVAIGCLRSIGLAARYVSGYIETVPPPGQERLVGADASHAWFAVYVPSIGWLDFDPTNNQKPYEQHITVAWGRDFSDVSPLKGVALGGGHHQVHVSVDVARLPDNGVRSRT